MEFTSLMGSDTWVVNFGDGCYSNQGIGNFITPTHSQVSAIIHVQPRHIETSSIRQAGHAI